MTLKEEIYKKWPLHMLHTVSSCIYHNKKPIEIEAELHKILKKASQSTAPLIVGPWLSEIGFEILYWIPFVRWAIDLYKIDAKRVWVISRGGCAQWYEGISTNFLEMFDMYSVEEFKRSNELRAQVTGLQKQMNVTTFDEEILNKACKKAGINKYLLLHPKYMYRLFENYWKGRKSISSIERLLSYSCLSRLPVPDNLKNSDYIAVKFYYSDSFPKTKQNQDFVDELISRLSSKNNVVLMHTGLKIDDHSELQVKKGNIIMMNSVKPNENLFEQTKILSNAKAFYGTYGGFSYLPPLFGVPSYSFYSDEEKFHLGHLHLAQFAFRKIRENIKSQSKAFAEDGKYEFSATNVSSFKSFIDDFIER